MPVKKLLRRSELKSRWLQLLLSSMVLCASYYCYDTPAALHDQLRDYMVSEDTSITEEEFEVKFNLLYTVYSIPNIVIPLLLGSMLCARYGAAKCVVIFSVFVCLGQAVVSLGLAAASLRIMLLGRFIFGLGGENLAVAASTLLQDWFLGAELGFSMGISLSVSRLGSVINNIASPTLAAQGKTVQAPFTFSIFVGLCGVLASVGAYRLDKFAERKLEPEEKRLADIRKKAYENGATDDPLSPPLVLRETKLSSILRLPKVFWFLSAS